MDVGKHLTSSTKSPSPLYSHAYPSHFNLATQLCYWEKRLSGVKSLNISLLLFYLFTKPTHTYFIPISEEVPLLPLKAENCAFNMCSLSYVKHSSIKLFKIFKLVHFLIPYHLFSTVIILLKLF